MMAPYSVISLILVLLTALIMAVQPARNLRDDPRYEVGDHIPLFANKVYPHGDPCDAHPYFDFPFCPPGSPVANRKKSFDEVLEGDCFTNTLYDLQFKVDKIEETLCEKQLTKDEVAMFWYAIKNRYEFQLYCNNIRMSRMIGEAQEQARGTVNSALKYYLFKHISFHAYYIENQVKDVHLWAELGSAVDITEGVGVKFNFTYSVFWKEINSDDYAFRNETSMDDYGWPTENQSSRKIALSIGLAAFIFCCVKLFSWAVQYLKWNQIHGDACRCPPYLSLLGATLGIGVQLQMLICSAFVLSYYGYLDTCKPQSLFFSLLYIYCPTSLVSGYIATSFHSFFAAIRWKECIFLTGVLYIVPVFITALAVNALVKIVYGISDLPAEFSTAAMILLKWGLGTTSLLCLGGRVGYAFRSNSRGTCATSLTQGDNPQPSWFTKTPTQMFLGGLLPFMTIFHKMDDIYASLWNLKVCGAVDTMSGSLVVVITLTMIVSIGFTYFQFSKQQDYQWWWRSVLRGGSTAIFMFAYGIYFHTRAYAHDFAKLIPYLAYSAGIFYALFLVLGTIGFHASSYVFLHLYPDAKKHSN